VTPFPAMSGHNRVETGLSGLTPAKLPSPVETGRRQARNRVLWTVLVLVLAVVLVFAGHALYDYFFSAGEPIPGDPIPA
jgi:hypothetical protein